MAESLTAGITKPHVQAVGLIDLGGMLLVKRLVDRGAVPYVGNNNLVSGALKLGIGGILHGKGGRIGHVVTGGVVLDGMDDIIGVLAGKVFGGSGNTASADVNPGAPN